MGRRRSEINNSNYPLFLLDEKEIEVLENLVDDVKSLEVLYTELEPSENLLIAMN